MEYKILPETDLNAFEEFVLSHGGNYLHSVKWSLVKKEWNSRFYSGFSESGERVLTALVMERKIPFAGKIWYCPSGALFDYKNEDLLQAFSDFMKKELKKNRVTALFYDPLIPLRINGEKREEGKRKKKEKEGKKKKKEKKKKGKKGKGEGKEEKRRG